MKDEKEKNEQEIHDTEDPKKPYVGPSDPVPADDPDGGQTSGGGKTDPPPPENP